MCIDLAKPSTQPFGTAVWPDNEKCCFALSEREPVKYLFSRINQADSWTPAIYIFTFSYGALCKAQKTSKSLKKLMGCNYLLYHRKLEVKSWSVICNDWFAVSVVPDWSVDLVWTITRSPSIFIFQANYLHALIVIKCLRDISTR